MQLGKATSNSGPPEQQLHNVISSAKLRKRKSTGMF